MLDAFLQSLGDGRRAFEIHVRDAHAGDDAVHVVTANHGVPFDAIGADAVVGRVEIELATRRSIGFDGRRGGSDRACDRCKLRGCQERSAIESVVLWHVGFYYFRSGRVMGAGVLGYVQIVLV